MKSQTLRTQKFKEQQQKIDCFFKKLNKDIDAITNFYRKIYPNEDGANLSDIKALFDRIFGVKKFVGKELTYEQHYLAFKTWQDLFDNETNPMRRTLNRLEIEVRYKERGHKNG